MMAPTWPEHSQRDRVCFHRSEKNRNCFHPACHRFNFLLSHQASQKNAPRSLKKRAVSDFSVTNITVTKKTDNLFPREVEHPAALCRFLRVLPGTDEKAGGVSERWGSKGKETS